ncbi:MAG: HIT domain-containing protein [Candidatus Omnitrophota bacterium]
MKRIWAPWRSQFIYKRKKDGCIFCQALKSTADKKHYVIRKNKFSFAMLNIYPYNNGHIMVAPNRHRKSLTLLKDTELADMMSLVNEMTELLDKILKPEGYNIGANIGKVAGAGFPGHVHIHIVPRWNGDTNFSPVISHTKIISESLDSLYKRLTK